jgi:hypothetical protein
MLLWGVTCAGVCTPAFLQQFHVNFFAVIEVMAERGMPRRASTAPKVIGHEHGYSRSRLIFQPCRFVVLLHNVRRSEFACAEKLTHGKLIPSVELFTI